MHIDTIYLMLAKYKTVELKLETLSDMIDLTIDPWTMGNLVFVRDQLLASQRDSGLL